MRPLIAIILMCLCSVSYAERFSVEGNVIYYNEAEDFDGPALNQDDADMLEDLLRQHTEVDTVNLNSTGGSVYAARNIAQVFIDFQVNTEVTHECSSACADAFLGGTNRVLGRGGRMGFHRSSWGADSIEEYYTENADYFGWASMYEMGSWIHEDAQKDIYETLMFMLEQGVDPGFAVKTLKKESDDMWYPKRAELLQSRFITE